MSMRTGRRGKIFEDRRKGAGRGRGDGGCGGWLAGVTRAGEQRSAAPRSGQVAPGWERAGGNAPRRAAASMTLPGVSHEKGENSSADRAQPINTRPPCPFGRGSFEQESGGRRRPRAGARSMRLGVLGQPGKAVSLSLTLLRCFSFRTRLAVCPCRPPRLPAPRPPSVSRTLPSAACPAQSLPCRTCPFRGRQRLAGRSAGGRGPAGGRRPGSQPRLRASFSTQPRRLLAAASPPARTHAQPPTLEDRPPSSTLTYHLALFYSSCPAQ